MLKIIWEKKVLSKLFDFKMFKYLLFTGFSSNKLYVSQMNFHLDILFSIDKFNFSSFLLILKCVLLEYT